MSITIRSVRFVNYKGFSDHTISIRASNVLVGANNAGKSTALGGLRLIVAMLPQARRVSPTTVGSVAGTFHRGWPITAAAMDTAAFSAENLRHDFRLAETRVEVGLSSGVRLIAVWPAIDDADEPAPGGLFFCVSEGRESPRQAARELTPSFGSIPTLTPLDDKESAITEGTLRRHASGRRSSRFFRNALYALSRDEWVDFTSYVYERTPELTDLSIERAMGGLESDFDLFYAEPETGHEREIGWAGDGIQIWIQLLYHLWRNRGASVLLLDEPDVFLHPDLQRRLARTLFDGSRQVVVATHSVEVLAEAEPGSAVWVDRSRRNSERPRADGSLGLIGRRLGSGYELSVGRALRSNAVLFVEGDDAPVLAHLARKAGRLAIPDADSYATVPLGGFSRNWRAGAFAETMEALGQDIKTFVILDSDLRSDQAIARETATLRRGRAYVHVWRRRELENYLLSAPAISRVSGLRPAEATALLAELVASHQDEARVAFDSQRLEDTPRNIAGRTVLAQSRADFDALWSAPDGAIGMVDAKSIIRGLNSELQRRGNRTLNAHALAKATRRAEMSEELLGVLDRLEIFIQEAANHQA